MSKVERKEYQETKIMRTVSPVRGVRGSGQNLNQFDSNLDYLLEDLQSSVPKHQGTGGTYSETRVVRDIDGGRQNSLNRVTHLKASNPVTEYSSDDSYSYSTPDGSRSVKSVKKESYSSYATSKDVHPEKMRIQNNINQLDSLLDDLKQVKHGGSNNSVGVDPGLIETGRSRVVMGKKTVEREFHYGDTPPPRSSSRNRDIGESEGSMTREIQYIDEGTYGETRPIRCTPSPSQSSTLTKQKQVTNVQQYPVAVVETTTPDINPEILAHLDPGLLPSGNTKVTTTIKTYTYEIPGAGSKPGISVDSEKYVYSPNQTQTTPSKSFVYSKVENSDVTNTTTSPPPPSSSSSSNKHHASETNIYKETTTTNQNIQPYQRPTPPVAPGTTIVKETTTTRNYQPGYQSYPDHSPPGKQTYVYNETTTSRNINEGYPPPTDDHHVRHPRDGSPHREVYIIREIHNTTNNTGPDPYPNGYPPQEPGSKTIIYKHDAHTTNYSQPPPPLPVQQPPQTIIYNKTETNTTDNYPYPGRPDDSPHYRQPNGGPPHDPNNVNITYKCTTHNSTSNRYNGYPPGAEESQPLLRPQPFPSDVHGPPKRVDELMAKIGSEPPDSPLNAGYQAHEADLVHQKKVDTLKRQQQQQQEANDLQKKERTLVPTKNITGPPVYYPPGHEMFAKKEESGAWRAQGAMARESGKYKYESESSSKMKTRSGAAVVPVCLPLCCGLPCTII